jgi:hypothetical protein
MIKSRQIHLKNLQKIPLVRQKATPTPLKISSLSSHYHPEAEKRTNQVFTPQISAIRASEYPTKHQKNKPKNRSI